MKPGGMVQVRGTPEFVCTEGVCGRGVLGQGWGKGGEGGWGNVVGEGGGQRWVHG